MQLSYLRRALLRPRPRGPPVPADAKHRGFSSSPSPKPEATEPPPPMPTRPWGEALAAAQRAFCLPLTGRVLAAAGTGNAAVAPPAVHVSLALAAAGARGATRRQVLQALGCGGGGRGGAADAANVASRVVKRVLKDRSTSGGPRLAFAGGVWADASRNLSPEFVDVAGNVYGSAAKKADFNNKKVFSEPMFLEQHLPTKKCHVGISVPNFTISFQVDVKDFLEDMGLELPFLRDAEFADMIKEDDSCGPLFLSDVLHKAVLEVNEKGIEETSVSMGLGKPLPAEHFNADRPFFFMIREEVSGTVIFMGHVLDPSSRS
ncbi:hypothetical protein E2562_027280 [Oryza meyeriana var. granulata]|uniref:Serpin domain-containing protein n=1 Tax=Oryza meyeriana var. granulata TaxID=110450 RepID=A0A6G1C7V2_9ORYZ|nr:hypothetical protein E2562_027280 [Oryza meyeriana var. granulata]